MLNVRTKIDDSGRDFESEALFTRDTATGKSGKRITGKNQPSKSVDIPNQ